MVYLYATDVSKLPDPKQCPEILSKLPLERQQKIERCLQEDKRKQSLGAGLLLNRVLLKHGVKPDRVYKNEHGKPEVDGLYFNLSHSGTMVICAVGEVPVGCDLEQIRKAPEKVAEHFFCESEKEYLKSFQGEKYHQEFFRLWTIKESYMKMTGEGMSLPLDAFEVQLGDEVRIFRVGELQPCTVKEYEFPGYMVTVCAEDTEFSEISWENI